MNNNDPQIPENSSKKMDHKYYLKYGGSLILASILVVAFAFSVAAGIVVLFGEFSDEPIKESTVIKYLSYTIAFTTVSTYAARALRTASPHVQIFGYNIPNFLYDPYFVKLKEGKDKELLLENQELKQLITKQKTQLEEQKTFSVKVLQAIAEKDDLLEQDKQLNGIFIRHHKNTSRLVRSLTHLLKEEKKHWKLEFMTNVLNECVTSTFKSQANKSASLFLIDSSSQKLKIFAYNRIDTSSAREKEFNKGEGFAGKVWEHGDTMKLENVYKSGEWSESKMHLDHYNSIIGTPVILNHVIIGVLCIQSEDPNGFTKDDEIMIRYYADICALAHHCDILVQRKEGVLI